MIRLTLRYARQDPRELIGELLVAFASAFCIIQLCAVFVALILQTVLEPGTVRDGAIGGASASYGAMVAFMLISFLVVGTSVTSLAVSTNYRRYAQWLAIGMPTSAVRTGVRLRAMMVGVVGSVLALPVAAVTFIPLGATFRALFGDASTPGVLTSVLGVAIGFVLAVLMVVSVGALASLRGAKRAATTPPADMLRRQPPKPRRWGIIVRLLVVGFLVAAAVVSWTDVVGDPEYADEPDGGVVSATGLGLLAVVAVAVLVPVVARPLMRAWTALYPDAASPSWFTFRRAACERASMSTTAITAVALAVGFFGFAQAPGDIGTMINGGEPLPGEDPARDWLGVLWAIGPVILIAVSGGAAALLIGAQQKEGDLRVLRGLGFSRARILRTSFIEPVIFSVTGLVLGLVSVVATYALGVLAAGARGIAVEFAFPNPTNLGLLALAMFVIMIAANAAPTLGSLRRVA